MTTTLDRMVLWNYFRSYAIVLSSLLSLYVIIDLFTNIDSFGRAGGGAAGVIRHVVGYYSYQIALIFDRLAEPAALMAAAFTVSWMQRNNELLPQLSAGIPTRRVIRPILIGSAVTLSFGPLNQEFILPRIAGQLLIAKDDPEGVKAQVLAGAYDPSGVQVEGLAGVRKERRVIKFYATFPENPPYPMFHVTADEAIYFPPGSDGPVAGGVPPGGGWWLRLGEKETKENPPREPLPPNLRQVEIGQYFLTTQDVDYDMMSRGAGWYLYAPVGKLRELLSRNEPRRQARVAVLFHTRVTRPITGALLVLLGLAVVLQNPNRHVFISTGVCLAFSVWFYLCLLGSKYLGDQGYVAPPLSAWLPVLLFGPITVVAFDSVHT
ncbi:MAG: LptF/LptG family permease [Gemmataceae bacterium]|uniref:Putative permease YjgP/YjgQ family protein n=1 Tax=Urbifossiella limnaea TaxID=2528023 RepID=A0A517XV53_9BACT|nr:LptF/LptG family permease [Urbifossiella limnaea]QDU21385.1 putative permease YjgP/YjgQ family protein [Urbifossiella limnaea]